MRSPMPFLAALIFGSIFVAGPAFARGHCWCEIATDCPRDGGRTVHDFGAIHSYARFESNKQPDCASRCGVASAGQANALRSNPDALCARLGPGVYDLKAYSKVGHRDTDNNWCSPDDEIGRLRCEKTAACPPGYDFDEGAGICKGYCGGRLVLTRAEHEQVTGSWLEVGLCDDGIIGEQPYSEFPVEVVDGAGQVLMLEDAFGDLEVDDLPAELDTADELFGGACGEDTCGGF